MSSEELVVVAGSPTAEELAALTAVLAARSAQTAQQGTDAPDTRPLSEWAAPRRALGVGVLPGAGAWPASGLPGSVRTAATPR